MKKWLTKNAFWLLAILTGGLGLAGVYKDNLLAAAAFLLIFVFSAVMGVYDKNVQFTKDVLTEYDRIVQQQILRRGLKVIKGGKKK